MSTVLTPKVLVVGGGPGGYVAAIRAGQLGLDTVLVEAGRLGGTCLTRGCIPSKALIHAAGTFADMVEAHEERGRFGIHLAEAPRLDLAETMRWKDAIVARLSGGVGALLRKARVRVVAGWAVFSDAKTCTVQTAEGPVTIRPEHVVLATGARPVELPSLPFGGTVISSEDALSLAEVPARLVVVGAGYVGLELGTSFAKFGSRVVVVEAGPRILPGSDAALSAPVAAWLGRHGVELHLGAKARAATPDGLEIETQAGEIRALAADRILVTAGRVPLTEGWGLDAMGLAMDGRFVRVDARCATATNNVWAIGDLVGEPALAHKASAQGAMVAEIIAGKRRRFDPAAIPAVCFTDPEIVSVGITAPGEGHMTGQFPFRANGRALTMAAEGAPDAEAGFVRVIAEGATRRVVGVQAVGRHCSELVGEFTTLVEMGATLEDVAGIIHAHPTLGEAAHEAALVAAGLGLHL